MRWFCSFLSTAFTDKLALSVETLSSHPQYLSLAYPLSTKSKHTLYAIELEEHIEQWHHACCNYDNPPQTQDTRCGIPIRFISVVECVEAHVLCRSSVTM